MYFSTDDAPLALHTNQTPAIAMRRARERVEYASVNRDHRGLSRRDRASRGSYYVFREGTLQVRLFDRQAIDR
jgi:hypothetical protein